MSQNWPSTFALWNFKRNQDKYYWSENLLLILLTWGWPLFSAFPALQFAKWNEKQPNKIKSILSAAQIFRQQTERHHKIYKCPFDHKTCVGSLFASTAGLSIQLAWISLAKKQQPPMTPNIRNKSRAHLLFESLNALQLQLVFVSGFTLRVDIPECANVHDSAMCLGAAYIDRHSCAGGERRGNSCFRLEASCL